MGAKLPDKLSERDAKAILDLCRVEVASARSLLMIGESDRAFKALELLSEDLMRLHPLIGQDHNVGETVEKFGLQSGR